MRGTVDCIRQTFAFVFAENKISHFLHQSQLETPWDSLRLYDVLEFDEGPIPEGKRGPSCINARVVSEGRVTGTIQRYGSGQFGWVLGDDSREYFFHIRDVREDFEPAAGMTVKFTPWENDRGPVARNIVLLEKVQT